VIGVVSRRNRAGPDRPFTREPATKDTEADPEAEERDYDVAVVGDGPAGAAYALSAARAGRTVVMVGMQSLHPHGTLELLAGGAGHILHRLGLLESLATRAPACVGTVFRWGRGRFVERPGAADSRGAGWVVDREWFDPLLREGATAAGVEKVKAVVSTVIFEAGRWQLACTRRAGGRPSRRICAGEVVLATGRVSKLANRCGLQRRVRHRMVAITAWVPGGLAGLGSRLLVDPGPSGWWYALGDDRGTVVGYVTDVDLLAAGSDRARATWRTACSTAGWLPPVLRCADLALRASVVAEVILPPVVPRPAHSPQLHPLPLGDAALAADPLSGHGLSIALDGALRATTNPEEYIHWLAASQEAHRLQERTLYGDEGRYPFEFWRRRRD